MRRAETLLRTSCTQIGVHLKTNFDFCSTKPEARKRCEEEVDVTELGFGVDDCEVNGAKLVFQ